MQVCAWVFVVNTIGRLSSGVSSQCVTLDFSSPDTGAVVSGASPFETVVFFATSTVYVSWRSFVDPRRGAIARYFVALTTSNFSAPDLVPWTSAGLQTTYAFQNVSVREGVTVYGMVYAVDRVGHASQVVVGAGQRYVLVASGVCAVPSYSSLTACCAWLL